MMDRGYFALWRKFQDHSFWKEPRVFSKAEAWIDILWNAQWKREPQEVILGMTVLIQNYGECLKSIRTWGDRWSWSEPKVRRFMKLLKNMKQIESKSEGVSTRIKVINFELYDPKRRVNDARPSRDRPTSDARSSTNNKEKKDNKVNKRKNNNCLEKKSKAVLRFLNRVKGSRYKNTDQITARLKAGGTVKDCITIIKNKMEDPHFIDNPRFLSPATLFRESHWDTYLNDVPQQKIIKPSKKPELPVINKIKEAYRILKSKGEPAFYEYCKSVKLSKQDQERILERGC